MEILVDWFKIDIRYLGGQSYIICGASAMLAGYTRLTYSVAVIMLETTQSINNFLPIMFTIMTSLSVARLFNRSLYEYAIRAKQMPLLRNHLPQSNRKVRVKQLLDEIPQEV